MELALVRHAIAEDGDDDLTRALSPKGKKRFRAVVKGLGAMGLRFDRVVHSPKLRALETAELLAPLADELESSSLLAQEPTTALFDVIVGASVALVGHEPHLSALVAWLVTGQLDLGPHFALKKGGVALLEGSAVPKGMQLVALLPPRLFSSR